MTTPKDVTPRWFRRAPVITEAVQWDGTTEHANALLRWMNADPERGEEPTAESEYWLEHRERGKRVIGMRSFNITEYAGPGDWIVRAGSGVYAPSNEVAFRVLHTEVDAAGVPKGAPSRKVAEVRLDAGAAVAVVLVVIVFGVGTWAMYRPGITWEPALALFAAMLVNFLLLSLVLQSSVTGKIWKRIRK